MRALLIELARLGLWLVVLTAIFVPLERLFALHRQKLWRKAIAVDLGYYFLAGLVPGLLLGGPLALVAWGAHRLIPAEFVDTVAALPVWARVAAAMLIGETGFYWGHRWSHEIQLLWRFHAIHHSAEQLDFLVNSRAHPVDLVFTRLCGLVPLYVLGLAGPLGASGSAVAIAVILAGLIWGFFVHANLRWRFGPLEWLISSPGFHHWHHTMTGPTNHNYASMLPWLDRLFGTFHLPRGQWPARYGIEAPMPDSLAAQLLEPLRHRA